VNTAAAVHSADVEPHPEILAWCRRLGSTTGSSTTSSGTADRAPRRQQDDGSGARHPDLAALRRHRAEGIAYFFTEAGSGSALQANRRTKRPGGDGAVLGSLPTALAISHVLHMTPPLLTRSLRTAIVLVLLGGFRFPAAPAGAPNLRRRQPSSPGRASRSGRTGSQRDVHPGAAPRSRRRRRRGRPPCARRAPPRWQWEELRDLAATVPASADPRLVGRAAETLAELG